MTHPRILVFADSGPRIGGGHVMRCLTLARALTRRGAVCAFAATPSTQAILAAFGAADLQTIPVTTPDDAARAADDFAAGWVLLDHYVLTPGQEAALRAGRKLAVLDDLADRPRAADLLMDSGYGRTSEAYRPLLPSNAVILTGPAYAPVRPEFAQNRQAALARRRQGGHLRHVLVSLGLTDVDGITGRVVELIRPRLGDLILDVVVGAAAPSLPALRERAKTDARLRLHIDTQAMAQRMVQADIAIGAGGSSTWERATLGLPTLSVVLADNQRPMAQAMAADGLVLTADVTSPAFDVELLEGLERLLGDPGLRRALGEDSAALCDGLGAERFAQGLLGPAPSR
jgi:UDP-2,4-diacetamido-2,4,6-trideoxy-beta-L-altropyranose hydrolase